MILDGVSRSISPFVLPSPHRIAQVYNHSDSSSPLTQIDHDYWYHHNPKDVSSTFLNALIDRWSSFSFFHFQCPGVPNGTTVLLSTFVRSFDRNILVFEKVSTIQSTTFGPPESSSVIRFDTSSKNFTSTAFGSMRRDKFKISISCTGW